MRAKQFMAFIRTNYALVMDPDKNPLWNMHPAQRFQVMAYLSVMWTTVFCAAFGRWYWYGELISAHMLVILGIAMTGLTFAQASRAADEASPIRSADGRR